MSTADPTALAAALNGMWTKFLPEMTARLSVIESAAASLAASSLTPAQQQAAASAAHKLAGVLGTFGLAQGTALARELETLYSAAEVPTPSHSSHILALTSSLRSMIENHKSGRTRVDVSGNDSIQLDPPPGVATD
jgi:HPt (histidine-containing phosphotransfer) domain-containing protein